MLNINRVKRRRCSRCKRENQLSTKYKIKRSDYTRAVIKNALQYEL